MDISRETYIGAEDAKTGRGLTYDLFTLLGKKIDRLNNRVHKLEQRTLWYYITNVKGKVSIKQLILLIAFISTLVAGGINHATIVVWLRLLLGG